MAVTTPTETGKTEGASGLGGKMTNFRVEFEVPLGPWGLAGGSDGPSRGRGAGAEWRGGAPGVTPPGPVLPGLTISKAG